MMTLQETLERIRPLEQADIDRALAKWNAVAKPLGSLGLLEDAVTQLCAMTGSLRPEIKKRCVVMFCADNGVVAECVTQTGSEVTAIVAKYVCTHDTSVCKMAEIAHADVFPVDMGMVTAVDDSRIWNRRIAAGTQDMLHGPAMTREQAIQGIETGIEAAAELAGRGYGLLATGEMGIGNSTPATAINCALFGFAPDEATGPGAGSDPERVRHKAAIVRRALEVNAAALKGDGVDILAALGGFELAIMAGIMLGAASRSLPILVDGFICSAAYAAAVRICPLVAQYAILSHASAEPGHVPALGALDSGTPLLHLDMRLGEGTGGAVAYHLLRCAVNIFNEMATFAEAQVDEGL